MAIFYVDSTKTNPLVNNRVNYLVITNGVTYLKVEL